MPTSSSPALPKDDVEAIDELRQVYGRLCDELKKIIVGQQNVVEQLSICLFARGHALLMGP
jgi:MoxR-like ATPase